MGLLLATMLGAEPAAAKWAASAVWDSWQREPIIGTQYSIAVPPRFRGAYDAEGVLRDDEAGAVIYALPSSDYEFNYAQLAAGGPLGSLSISMWNLLGRSAHFVEASGLKFLVLTRSATIEARAVRTWTVVPFQAPDIAIKILQLEGEDAVFDDESVMAAVKTLVRSAPRATRDGLYVFGLFVPAIPPFTWSAVAASGEGGDLSALVPGTDGYVVSFRRPRMLVRDSKRPAADVLLDESMKISLSEVWNPTVLKQEASTFVGLPALRVRARDGDQFSPTGYVEYVAWTIGYGFSLVGSGLERDMSDEIVGIIDRIARATRPQTSEELLRP